MKFLSKFISLSVLAFTCFPVLATGQTVPGPKVEFYVGADLGHRQDMQKYEFLIHINPAVKWHFGDGWTVNAQAILPVFNQFGAYYRYPRLGVADISKELQLGNHHIKASAGIFSAQRFGLDVKWMLPVCEWFALEAQLGLTGFYEMTSRWLFSPVDRVTGLLSARFYIPGKNTEIRLSGGRYNYGDYGARLEWLIHFKNFCSVSVFAQVGSHYGTGTNALARDGEPSYKGIPAGGGAKLIFMLPLQQRNSAKKVVFRPASNFRLTYDVRADAFGMKTYATDPEENEREGNFEKASWGFNQKEKR